MFFIKNQIDDSTVLTTEITDENVFTHCPDCGAEVQVDLAELAEDGTGPVRHFRLLPGLQQAPLG